ncbi:hypothetical protein GALMADRAFT_32022, partial [Galerina marginata CBS 339.88]
WAALTINPLIAEQLNYDTDALRADLEIRLEQMNDNQNSAYDRIVASVENTDGGLFFLNGSGGTGKTFVYNTVCAKLRSDQNVVLCVSSSGISTLLICGGRTAHSMFKIPIDGLHEGTVCPIPKNSRCGDLMRAAKVII